MASRFRRFTRSLFGGRLPVDLAARAAVGKHFVELENRSVPATFIVTNILDNQADVVGGLSLRQAINAANANPGFDRIEFNIPRSPSLPTIPNDPTENYFPIVLASTLPDLTDTAGVSIDATTQPRNNVTGTRPIVQLLPDPNPGAFPGQKGAFFVSGPNNVIRGFVITGFPGSAINLTGEGSKNNIILGNWINTDIGGTRSWNEDPFIVSARPPGTPPELTNTGPNENQFPLFVLGGITITDGASENIVGGVIDRNGTLLASAGGTVLGTGASVKRYDTAGNLVDTGILVTPALNRNIISGTPQFKKSYFDYRPAQVTLTRSDDIEGSGVGPGIRIMDEGTRNNLIQGNFIGTGVTGNEPIPNHNGIEIFNAATSNYIGNPSTNFVGDPVAAGIGNLIRFNENDGIRSAAIPNPSQLTPPPPPMVTGPYGEGDEFTTVTPPGSYGPSRANKLARLPFFDSYNPAYVTGPDNLTVVRTTRNFNPLSTTTTPDTFLNQGAGIEAQVGATVRLQGSGFLSTTAVTFNSSPLAVPNPQTVPAKFTVIDDANIDVIIPAGAVTPPTGFVGISVFTPAGVTTNLTAGFGVTILPSPPAQIEIVSTFSPSSGLAGEKVSVFGTGFIGTQSVTVGGVVVTNFTVLPGGNQIDFIVPTGAQTGPITVITPGGSSTTTRDFRVEAQPPPIITNVNKSTAIPGEEITLTGVNFLGAYLIRFNYAGGASGFTTTNFIVDSATQIRVKVPTLATASTNPIQVVTNDGFGVTLTPLQITTPAAPIIAATSLASGPIGSIITITGQNFLSANRVTFSGVDAFNFKILSPNQIQAVVPFGLPPGTVSAVRVVSSGGTSVANTTFTVSASLPPTVNAIPSGFRNNFTVVNGTNLFGTTKVLFGDPINGTPAEFEVLSNTQIRVRIPSTVASNGQFYVYTAYNTQDPLGNPAQNSFNVQDNQIPVIGSGRQSDPISGIIGSTVTLRGTGFLGTQRVLFQSSLGGTVAATNLEIVSDRELRFTVPRQAISGPISVVTPGTPDTSTPFSPAAPADTTTIPFTILPSPAPSITGNFPVSGPIGTTIVLSGFGFTGAVQVLVGGAVASEFEVESDNLIRLRVPALAQTGVVSVITPGGTATTVGNFTLTASPVPTLQFSTPRAARNTQVTISGTGLAGTSKVQFNDVPAQFTIISDTLITAIVPLTAAPGEIRVFTPGGSVPSPTLFTLDSIPAPVLGLGTGEDSMPVGGTFRINGAQLEGVFAASVTNIDTGVETAATFDFDPNSPGTIYVHMPEVAIGRYQATVYANTQKANDNWNFPTPTSPDSGIRYDFSYSTGVSILGTAYEYGDTIQLLPNARPVVTGVFANDGVIARGAPIYIRGSGFTGANRIQLTFTDDNGTPLDTTDDQTRVRDVYNNFNIPIDFDPTVSGDEFLAFDGVQRFRVLSDNQILLTLPQDFDGTTEALNDAIVTVFTPNGTAPADLTSGPLVLAAAQDDLPSLQKDAVAQIDIGALQAVTFTTSGDGGFFGQTVTLTATGGTNFYGVTGIVGKANDANGTGQSLGTNKAGYHPFALTNPTAFRDFTTNKITLVHTQDAGIHGNFSIIPGTGGTQAKIVLPTTFAKIPDGNIIVAPGSPPAPQPPPQAKFVWTAQSPAGNSDAPAITINRPTAAPTITSKGYDIQPDPANGFKGTFNRTVNVIGNASLITADTFTLPTNGLPIVLDRNNTQSAGTVFRFIMPAQGTTWPTGNLTIDSADGQATTDFGTNPQRTPQIFAFAVNDQQPQDNRFLANRIFDNGITIQRDPTNGFVTGVTPKTQAQQRTNGNLGIDFVTLDPRTGTTPAYTFGYALPNQTGILAPNDWLAGNQGKGGIDDGAPNSFSLPSAISALPTDPNFATIALPSGLGFTTGTNSFNNTQYGRYFGPNLLQNFPLLQVVQSGVDRTTFSTALLGKPFRSYRIDYYYTPGVENTLSDSQLDPFLASQTQGNFTSTRFDDQDATARATTNVGSGQIYLGSKIITTDGKGDGSVNFIVYKRLPDANGVIPALQPGEFQLPNNEPLVPSTVDPVTGNVTFRAGVVTSTATDLTAPGPDGPILTAGPDGTSRFSFFKRVDTPTGAISGRVILDKNANGIIDPNEGTVSGAKVGLFIQRDDGTYPATANSTYSITDDPAFFFGANGFGGGSLGIPNGKHKLVLTLPTGGTETYFYETPADGVRITEIISGETDANQDFLVTSSKTVNNTPPTISDIPNASVASGSTVGPVNFTVGDIETPAANLTVTVSSSNAAVVNAANIVLGGSGADRTITVPTIPGANGSSTITVTVTDAGGLTATDLFVVNAGVPPANTPPTITDIADVDTVGGVTVGPLAFTIGDAETPAANLNVSITSSNGTVVPPANVVVSGTGSSRAITITMPTGVTGTSTLTVTVTDDGGLSAADTFTVTVPPPPGSAPALLAIGSDAGRTGQVKVYRPNGTFLYTLTPYGDGFTGGVRVATGDVTGDGNADIITAPGIGIGGLVKIYDGITGTFLGQYLPYGDEFRGGVYVVAADNDGDGVMDIITGTGKGGGPRVRIVQGGLVGGALPLPTLNDFFPYESKFRGGVLVAAGNVNGDKYADIITGTGVGGGPRVRVLDGTKLQSDEFSANPGAGTLYDFFAYDNRFRGGVFASVGDVDGDGVSEILTGTGVGGGPVVKIFQQSTLASGGSQPVADKSFLAYDPNFRGGVRVDSLDGNGDGIVDIVTAPGVGLPPEVRVINYNNLQDIYRITAFEQTFNGGVFVGGNVGS